MPVLPNTGVTTPTVGGSSGTWGTENNSAWSNYDNHDHAAGNGKRINSDAIEIDGDVTFASLYAPTNVHRMTFAAITALSSGARAIFVDTSGNLWFRNSSGTNVRITLGSQLDLSATGGIQGDYAAVSAQVAFDDSNDRYTFKQNSATGWARLASGEVRILETGSSETVYVGLAAPAALAASHTMTLPLAAPGSDALLQLSSAGVMSASNTVANAATFAALTFAAQISITGVISPGAALINGNNNDYNPTGLSTASVIRVTAAGIGTTLTGLAGGVGGRVVTLIVAGGSWTVLVKDEDANSTAENRFALPASTDVIVTIHGSITFWYDGTTARWRPIAQSI